MSETIQEKLRRCADRFLVPDTTVTPGLLREAADTIDGLQQALAEEIRHAHDLSEALHRQPEDVEPPPHLAYSPTDPTPSRMREIL